MRERTSPLVALPAKRFARGKRATRTVRGRRREPRVREDQADDEAGHALEVPDVSGHELEAVADCGRGDQE